MSIARAFTTRRVKQSTMLAEGESIPHRSHTTKASVGSIRNKISAPVELIYTTNMLSYNAPDIIPQTARSTSSSHKSDDDLSDSATTTASTPPTSPDTDSPKRTLSPEPNHLSSYFAAPGQIVPASLPSRASKSATAPPSDSPVVPHRAISHTKKSYDSLPRQRSDSRVSEQSQRSLSSKGSFNFSRSSSSSSSTTATSMSSAHAPFHRSKTSGTFTPATPPPPAVSSATASSTSPVAQRKDFSHSQHPFGPELAQVTEIAEEYGVKEKLNEVEMEEKELAAKGLQKFKAEDYANEIQGLFSRFLGETRKPQAAAAWI